MNACLNKLYIYHTGTRITAHTHIKNSIHYRQLSHNTWNVIKSSENNVMLYNEDSSAKYLVFLSNDILEIKSSIKTVSTKKYWLF